MTLPPHTFRNGDPARIEDVKGEGVDGIVYRVSAERVVVAVEEAPELPERLRLVKLANTATFDRMDRTMDKLEKSVDTGVPLVNVLLGSEKPRFKEVKVEKWFTDLNDSQRSAIEHCLGAETVACIHGPPGTGKTHTLVELIYQLLIGKPKILVTTPSNLALDNLLLRLYTLSKQEPFSPLLPRSAILRIGHPTRVQRDLIPTTLDYQAKNGDDGELIRDITKEIDGHLGDLGKKRGDRGAVNGKERGKRWEEVRELRKEYRQREAKVVRNVVGQAQVVLATCHSAGSRQLNNVDFDICIVDEATQAIEAVCWVPILKAKRVILAGDPKQLPPTIMSSGKGLETTLFDRLEKMHPGIKRVLTTQYRMNERIASFPSDTLYESALISHPSVSSRTLADITPDDDLTPPVIFFDTAGCDYYERTDEGESTFNENEAVIVEKWARRLVQLGIEPKDIAIVTPYQAQVALISSMLDFPEMTIGSVDGLQGQEREAIILSLVRSNTKGEVGFLSEYRRLNVAMTRAKRQLCVVGDSATVGKGSGYLKKWMAWLEAEAEVRYAGDIDT